jgi:hypothetical protein
MTNNNPWGETVPYGTYMGYTAMSHAFSQTLTFGQGGDYVLRFLTKTRAAYALPQYHDFEVLFGGQSLGRFFNMGAGLRRYELALPAVAADTPYTLQFKGLQTFAGVNTLSLFDQVEIAPAPPPRERESLGGRFPETVALEVAAGASLVLDYTGQIRLRDVRYAGRVVSGTISAATHPEFVSGPGSLYAPAKGTAVTIR